ncbi:MAG TPA: hypothetical protein VF761_16975 [Gemmatimonadaceae bacterium]
MPIPRSEAEALLAEELDALDERVTLAEQELVALRQMRSDKRAELAEVMRRRQTKMTILQRIANARHAYFHETGKLPNRIMLTPADAEEWRQWCADHPEAQAEPSEFRAEALNDAPVMVEGDEFKVWREEP